MKQMVLCSRKRFKRIKRIHKTTWCYVSLFTKDVRKQTDSRQYNSLSSGTSKLLFGAIRGAALIKGVKRCRNPKKRNQKKFKENDEEEAPKIYQSLYC